MSNISEDRIERIAIALWVDESKRVGQPSLNRSTETWLDNLPEMHAKWRRFARAALESDAPALEAARVEGMRETRGIVAAYSDEQCKTVRTDVLLRAIDARISALRGKEE